MKRPRSRSGPGPAKAGLGRFVDVREWLAVRSVDYRWNELFEAADVMSEGAVREERDGACYYGTTSLLLPLESRGGLVPDALSSEMSRLVAHDVHARVRAVRVACREARVRAVHPLGRVRAELVVRPDSRGVRIDVDVEAKCIVASRRTTRARTR